jgi:uncharacterized protein
MRLQPEQIYTFGTYLNERFGAKTFKVPVSISGFTCPNIDGTVARGGCTFCENDSFSPSLDKVQPLKGFHLNLHSEENPYLAKQLEQLEKQFEVLSKRQAREYGVGKFLVYFQSFTNTYAPFETLKALYDKALSFDNVVGLSIGTRSDSITDETLAYLSELAKTKEIWVEYGIQSVYDETLERINRGHDSANVERWIKKSKAAGLNVCGHLIFGLPGESQSMMLETAKKAYDWGIDSVKYHPLYVVKRTALANEYARGEFMPIGEEEYIDTLLKALEMKPANVSVQRITAGMDDDSLIAPEWCRDRNVQVRHINASLKKAGLKY